jgi:diguanylate cyclase (GGDEF)-like protein
MRLARYERRSLRFLSLESARALARLRETRLLELDAETDPLTGLYNRRSYNRALEQLLPGDVVVLLDLDHFKNVNDRFGHATGDEVLAEFANALKSIARKSDSVARYGGEEFAWILPGAGIRGAQHALERLQELWRGADPLATFSAGYALHTAQDVPTTTLARADHALYQAKNNGRNRVELAPAPTQDQI